MNPAITRLLLSALLLIMVTSSCSDAVNYYNRGIVEKVNGDLKSAERDFQRAVQINPNYAEAHFSLGAIILQKGRVDEAILHFQKTLAIKPGDANARKELEKALRSKEQTILEADIPTGKLAFVTSANFGSPGTISVISGRRRITTPAYDTRELEFLPDGNRIIYCANDSQAKGIYIYDLTQHTDFPLVTNVESASEPFWGKEPSWSPDGDRIAFVNNAQIYRANIDGTERKQLTAGEYYNWSPRWSSDGRKLVFETTRNDTPKTHGNGGYRDIYVMDGNGQNQINLTKSSYGHHPSWSPDGKSIAYMSHGENGHASIFVMRADGSSKQNISKAVTRDSEPVWSPDGQWIAFTRTTNKPFDSEPMDIWIMKSDGTEQRQVTFNRLNITSYSPSWGR